MGVTFTRVNGVAVDTSQIRTSDLYPDPGFNGGSYAANLAQPLTTTASQSLCYRGMPVGVSPSTGMLVPISASGATYIGALLDDLTAYVIARGTKVAFVHSGKIRSYAAIAMPVGQLVIPDTAASFGGFKPFASSAAFPSPVGQAFPLDDGSAENGSSAASTMAQGDNIFVNLFS